MTPGDSSTPRSSIETSDWILLQVDDLEVDVHEVAAHGMALLFLDHDGLGRGAVESEVEERGAGLKQCASFTLGDAERARLDPPE